MGDAAREACPRGAPQAGAERACAVSRRLGHVSWRRALAAEVGSQQRWLSLCHLFGLGWCLLAGIPGTSSSE